jgi:formamidopyrimidine-DNA glycosylase
VHVPELPELEALARSLDATVTGRDVVGVDVRSPSLLKTYAPPVDELVGDAFTGVRRRGKWLLFGTRASRTLAVHLMTGGRLRRTDGKAAPARADGTIVRFADGTDLRVTEIGSRKQSAVHFVVGDGSSLIAHLGPEPLAPEFGVNELAAALGGPARQVKSALVDQRTLAGIGNAWSDEVLHAARLSPLLSTARLTSEQVAALYAALRDRLADGIVSALRDNYLEKLRPDRRPYLRIHKRDGEPCFVCRTPLAAIHHGERQTTYCPTCQVDGRLYADRRLSRLLR